MKVPETLDRATLARKVCSCQRKAHHLEHTQKLQFMSYFKHMKKNSLRREVHMIKIGKIKCSKLSSLLLKDYVESNYYMIKMRCFVDYGEGYLLLIPRSISKGLG